MLRFVLARTPKEYALASELVTGIYVQEGYVNEGEVDATSITGYIGKKQTTTLLAYIGAQLVGTISVVEDGVMSMPMAKIYEDELTPFRIGDTQIGEVCQFAVDKEHLSAYAKEQEEVHELDVSIGLFAYAIQYAEMKAYKYLCFAINPKHLALYESLGCVQIGEEKQYDSVNQAPALGYILDMDAYRKKVEKGEGSNFLVRKILEMRVPADFWNLETMYLSR